MHARANLIKIPFLSLTPNRPISTILFLYYRMQIKWCPITRGSWILLLPDGQLVEFKLQKNCNKSGSLFLFIIFLEGLGQLVK